MVKKLFCSVQEFTHENKGTDLYQEILRALWYLWLLLSAQHTTVDYKIKNTQ